MATVLEIGRPLGVPTAGRVGRDETRLMPTRKRERNQQLFRQVNERIRDANASFELTTEQLEFLCECGDPYCTEQVTLTVVAYERIPRIGGSFLVKPGHERDGQRIVERNDGYAIVEDLTAAQATLAAAPSSQHDDATSL